MTKTDGLKTMGRGVLTGALCAAALLGASAQAQDLDKSQGVKVYYRDLDLATPQGVAAFDVRLHRAAETLYPTPSGHLLVPMGIRKARSEAIAQVKPRCDELVQAASNSKTMQVQTKEVILAGR